MAKEILLYTSIFSFTAEDFINKVNEAAGQDLVCRINGPGGSVFAGYGMLEKLASHDGNVKVHGDGIVASMYTAFFLYADERTCLDVTRFMIHRANGYVETDEDRQRLVSINKDLKKKYNAVVDSKKLKEISGYTIDEIYDAEDVIDVWLTAKEAKAIGLVDKIIKLTPKNTREYKALYESIAACADTYPTATTELQQNIQKQTKQNTAMTTLAELKAQAPALYEELLNKGIEAGVKQERTRVNALIKWVSVDAKFVTDCIAEGKEMDAEIMSDLAFKKANIQAGVKLEEDSPAGVQTPEAQKGTEDAKKTKELEAFVAGVKAMQPKVSVV